MSATVNVSRAPVVATPGCGCSVVNGYAATSGSAREIARSSDGLPAFGKPTRPTSATNFSARRSVTASPAEPSSAALTPCSLLT